MNRIKEDYAAPVTVANVAAWVLLTVALSFLVTPLVAIPGGVAGVVFWQWMRRNYKRCIACGHRMRRTALACGKCGRTPAQAHALRAEADAAEQAAIADRPVWEQEPRWLKWWRL